MCRWRSRWLAVLLSAAGASVWAWTAPTNPDPKQILKEAREDARARRFEEAAAKHRWYHDNVLRLLPSHSGVRLSFALGDWYDLAKRYEPAMNDFRAERDRVLRLLRAGEGESELLLLELTRFNEQLNEPETTREGFHLLARRDPGAASRALRFALPALVSLRAYELAGTYMNLKWLTDSMAEHHATLSDTSRIQAEHRESLRRHAKERADREWARVVVTLVHTGRRDEARQVADQGRRLLGADAGSPLIDAALRGEPPPPDRG